MPPQYKVIAFQNTNPYPISFFIRGIRGKVCLWQGQQIRNREGYPLVPPQSEWAWLISKGVKPVYLTVPETESPRRFPAAKDSVETILDDAKLMEAKSQAQAANLASEFASVGAPEPGPMPKENGTNAEDSISAPVSYLERTDNPDPNKGNLVWQDHSGMWILNKDGYAALSPAAIKKHIRRVKNLGKDFLEALEWRHFGSKTAEPEVSTAEDKTLEGGLP